MRGHFSVLMQVIFAIAALLAPVAMVLMIAFPRVKVVERQVMVVSTADEQCMVGKVQILHPHGDAVFVGEMEFCGRDLHQSGIYGPSMEKVIEMLEAEVERLTPRLPPEPTAEGEM